MRPEDACKRSNLFVVLLALGSLLFFSLLLSGCSTNSGTAVENNLSNLSNSTSVVAKDPAPDPPAVNITPAPKITNTCQTGSMQCPDGTNVSGTWCTSGYSNVPSCKNTVLGNTTGIPDTLLYLAKFKCYWDIRNKYGYGNFFDPTTACASKNGGWEEACACSDFVQRYNYK